MNKYLAILLPVLLGLNAVYLAAMWRPSPVAAISEPPNSIVICGIDDHPCVVYAVNYHKATIKYGDHAGEGVTDYDKKSISIALSDDRFENVRSLEHEVYHAVLYERGIRDDEVIDLHSWIYLSEAAFTMVLHDNPKFVQYILSGYRTPGH